MDTLFYDLETRWSRKEGHSVSKQNPLEYFTDPRTEIQMMGWCLNAGQVNVITGEENIKEFWDSYDWSDTMLVAHNGNGFDHPITSMRFGVKPKLWGDTLAMARPIYGKTVGGSLAALGEQLKLGKKGNLENTGTEGLYVREWTAEQQEAMEYYCRKDVRILRKLFVHLLPGVPMDELKLIDLTCRMLTEPALECDIDLLRETLTLEQAQRANSIQSLANLLDVASEEEMKARLMSNIRFSDLLAQLGVPCPMKVSPTTGKETYALAKSDQALLNLLEHDDPLVVAAVEARLGAKSTILESRLKTFITMGECAKGKMPIALNYAGATATHRWSGGFSQNGQNLPRIDPKNPKLTDALRNCLRAPKGHKVVVVDLSGIELRVNHYLWQVDSSMELYAADPEADLYKAFAAKLYHIKPEEVSKHQRQFAKLCQLGLGYGMSANKFRITAKQQGVELTLDEAETAVSTWRDVYSDIVDGWASCDHALKAMKADTGYDIDPWGLCKTDKQRVLTPPQNCLYYTGLRKETDEESQKQNWVYGEGRHKRKIYGSHLDENLVQHLARNILAGHMLKIAEEYPVVHTVHDEVVCVVPTKQAETCLQFMLNTMKTPPAWWSDIVLWAEGSYGDTYGECK